MRFHVVLAIFRRDFVGYFSSPTGYVFITVFIFLSAAAAFWQDQFFAANLANLNTLNRLFPMLLLFLVPAITMNSWADERRQGVDELLLTLPVKDLELVGGKYLAAVGIYTVALLFSVSHWFVLAWLGRPDAGLMLSNYLAYWLLGAALLAVGMVGSVLTDNLTVGFIFGAGLCAVPVFLDMAGRLVGGRMGDGLATLGAVPQFEEMTSGVVSLGAFLYFAAIAASMLFLNYMLVGRRRWRVPFFGAHAAGRAFAAAVGAGALVILAGRLPLRLDFTAEGLHSLTKPTREIILKIDPANPVYIQAYVSREVPRAYVETRANLVNLLREYAALGGDRIRLKIVEAEKYTDEAREAEERFDIRPTSLTDEQGGRTEEMDVFLGVAVTCGADEVVTPFFYKGLAVEYELTRSIRVVSRPAAKKEGDKPNRLKIGLLETDAKIFGGFDFQSMASSNEWELVRELRKQYEVVNVKPDDAYPDDLAVLVAVLPSSLTQPQMDKLAGWIKKGKPTLLVDDPFPAAVPGGAPGDPKGGQRNPFQGGPPPEQKGKITEVMSVAGLRWMTDEIAWDKYNPHPKFAGIDPEIVFVGPGNGAREAFNAQELTSSGLQEVVLIFPGVVEARGTPGVNFIPLLNSGKNSGIIAYDDLMERSFFGSRMNPNRKHVAGNREMTVAARTSGTVNCIFIADVDMISEQFFDIRRQGREFLELDNITFFLNCVDQLAMDESFIELRKRRRRHRTLDKLEERTREHTQRQLREEKEADEAAEKKKKEAQDRFDAEVKKIEERTDIDVTTKEIMAEQYRQVEQRKLEAERKKVEDDKERTIEASRARTKKEVEAIQWGIRILGTFPPPIPALILGVVFFFVRLSKERGLAGGDRWVGGGGGPKA